MPYKEMHYRWEYDLKASPEKLWPFVADTNRFNRDAKVPAVQLVGENGRLRNARQHVRLSMLGMPVEWEEQPFEWVRPSRFGVRRTYRKGPVAEMRALAELTAREQGGTKFTYNVWVKPKSLLGVLVVRIQVGLLGAKRFRKAFEKNDELARTESPAQQTTDAPELSTAATNRLLKIRARLIEMGAHGETVDRLVNLVARADDFALARIKPYELADVWHQPRRALLETCLRATRLGLLDLQWDLLCPLCRGPQESSSSLSAIDPNVHCETCQIDFTVSFDRFVELTFRPNASIRAIDSKNYCIGSPQRTPHVVAQQLIRARNERIVTMPLEAGTYRFRALEMRGEQSLKARTGAETNATVTLSGDGWSREELSVSLQPTLKLRNETDDEHLFILERMSWSDTAATAAEVTSLQVFRDLFSTEALRPGEQISVGTLTVLFTDLRNSTQLYREIGDATAFGRVMNHFDVLKKAIADEDGALVKTIGDAVMAVFRRPVSAVRSVLSAQQMLAAAASPLTLKAGIHSGPCIAVTLNDRLDYFGSTVNMAARLEGLSSGEDVVISHVVYDDPEVQELLDSCDFVAAAFKKELKGFDQECFELWRVMKNKTSHAVERA
jgi:class 3 adenylate cyclase